MKQVGEGYLHDESRLSGQADYIAFPEDAIQAAALIRRAIAEGLVLSSERMNRPLGFTGGEFPALRGQGG
jgi:hypothetical protein